LWTWGWGYDGQLGDGSFLNRTRPIRVLEGVLGVAVGNLHTLVLLPDKALGFGHNERGQLGDGTFASKGKPVPLSLPAKALAAGYAHSLILSPEGRVYAAGSNEEGQLGESGGRPRSRFLPVEGLPPVVGVAAGYFHSLAWTEGGDLWAWGSNLSGQLGTGTVESSPRPLKVLERVRSAVGGGSFTAALLQDGSVWVTGLDSATFRRLEGLPKARALAAGRAHLLVLGEDGQVYALGENEEGQLGDGTREGRLEARRVEGLEGV
ncbi:chromosome condensation regulator RCC1, partial [Thermus scotoductus]